MDAGGDMDINVSAQELQKLTPADHHELQTFVQNEGQKAQVQKSESDSTTESIDCKL